MFAITAWALPPDRGGRAAGLAVEVEVGGLFEAFKFEKNLLTLGTGGQDEMLAIPAETLKKAFVAAAVADELAVGVSQVWGRLTLAHGESSKAGAKKPGS